MNKHLLALSLCLILRVWWSEQVSLFHAEEKSGIVQGIGDGRILVKREDNGKIDSISSSEIQHSSWDEEAFK